LIGDKALQAGYTGLKGFPHVYDLGLLWSRRTGHSFVFAQWVVRRNLPEKTKERMKKDLMASLERYRRNKTLFSRLFAERLGLPPDMVRRYLDGFVYELRPADLRAAALFRRKLSVEKT